METQTLIEITPKELLTEAMKKKKADYRLAAITCTSKEELELTYSFDKEYDFAHIRFLIEPEVEIESISGIYPYAFLYENEIKELFGVKINNISLDYNNTFYNISEQTPFQLKKEKE